MCLTICCYSRIMIRVGSRFSFYCADDRFLRSGPRIIDYIRNPKTEIPIPNVIDVRDGATRGHVDLLSRCLFSFLFSVFSISAALYFANILS